MTYPVTVRLFGSLAVQAGETRLGPRDLGGVKPRQIFEILVLERGHPVPKDRLTDLLWGERLPQNAPATLETYVSVVRRRLGEYRDLVATQTEAYRIQRDWMALDLDRFDELIKRAAVVPSQKRRRPLESALGLVRGGVLEDEPYSDWADRVRRYYREQIGEARLEAGELALAEGDDRAARAHAERAVAEDPLNERGHRLLMLACYASGSQQGALQAFETCRTTLADELGLDPSPEAEELQMAILRQEDPADVIERMLRVRPTFDVPSPPASAMLQRQEMHILVVEDSPSDLRLISEALESGAVPVRLHVVEEGEEALAFLRAEGPYTDAPRPDLVLLDLNLPGLGGREVLAEVKGDPELRRIPVVVLTMSAAEQDVLRSYDLHANSYVTKPADPDDFTDVVRAIESYWPVTVPLPTRAE